MVTNHLPAGDPDLEGSLPLNEVNEEDGTLMDGVSLPDESPAAQLPAPMSVRSHGLKSGTIIVTVCLLAGLANLVMGGSYLYEGWEQWRLTSEIEAASGAMSELPEAAEAQILLTRAELAFDVEHRAFYTLNRSSEVTQDLLDLAESVEITILEVVTEAGDAEEVGQNTYGALSVSLQVAGSTDALAAFLYELEQGILPGGRVDEVNIEEIPPPETGGLEEPTFKDGTEDSEPGWSSHTLEASVALTVYERQGNWD